MKANKISLRRKWNEFWDNKGKVFKILTSIALILGIIAGVYAVIAYHFPKNKSTEKPPSQITYNGSQYKGTVYGDQYYGNIMIYNLEQIPTHPISKVTKGDELENAVDYSNLNPGSDICVAVCALYYIFDEKGTRYCFVRIYCKHQNLQELKFGGVINSGDDPCGVNP